MVYNISISIITQAVDTKLNYLDTWHKYKYHHRYALVMISSFRKVLRHKGSSPNHTRLILAYDRRTSPKATTSCHSHHITHSTLCEFE